MQIWKYIYTLLLLSLAGLILVIFSIPDNNLHIVACDVGQGDAILITYKNIQILTDGGPNNKVIDCLGKYVPFYDREIELVILTHPQKDHYYGLVEVFKQYKVDTFISSDYQVPEISTKNAIQPTRGQIVRLGLISLDILTDQDEQGVVTLLKYGSFKALFMADMEKEVVGIGPVNYIKVNHHGSKNGLTEDEILSTMPKIAVISVGKNNTYGHPHQEILDMLQKSNVLAYRTDLDGNVEIVTDGNQFWCISKSGSF